MKLPITIAQKGWAMRQIGMTLRLALRADFMLTDHAIRTRHSNQRAEIDERSL